MRTVALSVNGRPAAAPVAARTSLADYLRETLSLTGTHVGCEHGVCGACTVLIDGVPARSCITFAAACEGASVTTIEGLEADPVTDALRAAFSRHHGLQCGFCTPAMLVTARDIVTRLPDADEARIRAELSGNLCRCTGYVGIVAAIREVLAAAPAAPRQVERALGPVGARTPEPARTGPEAPSAQPAPSSIAAQESDTDGAADIAAQDWDQVLKDGTRLAQSFTVTFPPSTVWRFFADAGRVAGCMPGARVSALGVTDGGRQSVRGEVRVKLGPIVSAFGGVAEIETDEAAMSGTVRGLGRDANSDSRARAVIRYDVADADSGTPGGTRVDVTLAFLLSGTLAQIGRSGLVRDVADHVTRQFVRNLEAALSGTPAAAPEADVLDAGAAARSVLGARLLRFFRRLFGRG
ncbi:xanthine dehydrogenase family Fe-S subunit [Ancylobacter mangrovi]|uniref:xanthine dehydrogenase family Fe-S subunit n=1 Tax=Ancylobacter mangrovi TaxID=2972472 RepID=UPI0021625848|nr:2Fe-2S iron-sulfur cluster-binding protein [Ancylobacter mangrovi]MCS0505128.1 2Fe-2S iron-sulfur cluster-binding protein [Ancylobacter mangrovi]